MSKTDLLRAAMMRRMQTDKLSPRSLVAGMRDKYPALSASQHRLWFLEQLDPAASRAYIITCGYALKGELDVSVLRRALDEIIRRHEILRTTFEQHDGIPFQKVHPEGGSFPLSEHEVGMGIDAQAEVQSLVLKELHVPFPLSVGPLVRGLLLRHDDQSHVLIIYFHHIISDGWSTNVFLGELCRHYADIQTHGRPLMEPLALQFADYAAWSKQRSNTTDIERLRQYWKSTLHNVPVVLTLPIDFPRPPVQTFNGTHLSLEIDHSLVISLRRLATEQGVTMFSLLLGAWSILMARISGEDDIVIGVPVANRESSQLGSLIGFFVNTLAIRIRTSGDLTLLDLIRQVQLNTLSAIEHQALSFDEVVETVNPPRSVRHSPIFQTAVAYHHTHGANTMSFPNCTITPVSIPHSASQFDMTLHLTDTGDELRCLLEYNTSLWRDSSIARFGRCFNAILRQLIYTPVASISEMSLMESHDRFEVAVNFAQSQNMDYPVPDFVHHQFEQTAALHPKAIAIAMDGQEVTYSDLNRHANYLAVTLINLGAKPGQRVVICARRSIEQIAGVLAVLKCGSAYVPMDPDYPSERLRYMLEDCGPSVVLLGDEKDGHWLDSHGNVLVIRDLLRASETAVPLENPDPVRIGLTVEDCAYQIYTSGSTGQPKGAMVPHRGLSNLIDWYRNDYGFDREDSVLAVTSFSFDLTQKNLLMPLVSGGKLVLSPNVFDPQRIVNLIERERITTLNLTPSFFSALVDLGRPSQFATLRRVFLGGEPIVVTRFLHLRKACPAMKVINSYGPTECSDVVSAYTLDDNWEYYRDVQPPIGKPIRRNQIFILDTHGQPVPVGVVGEIYVAGCGVGLGYLNRAELTEDRFIRAIFPEAKGVLLYRTGDLGRWNDAGEVLYLGRNDFQVKYRGFRIETGEIEARIAEYPEIRDVAVIVREDVPGQQQLVAYIVTEGDETSLTVALRSWLRNRLPDYMVPSIICVLASLPVTPSGKLDRKALPIPAPDESEVKDLPQDPMECLVAEVWESLLGIAPGRHTDFFSIGGHSLLAVQVVSRLQQRLGISIAARDLFSAPMLCDFSARISQSRSGRKSSILTQLRAGGNDEPLVLIHPGEGELGYARTIAPWLPDNRPLLGIAASGLLPGEPILGSIEEMATTYLRELRHLQPRGPYWLAGWSAGGTIAFEMAIQLRKQGDEVAFLGLIDTASDYARLGIWHAERQITSQNSGRAVLGWFNEESVGQDNAHLVEMANTKTFDEMLLVCQNAGWIPSDLDRSTFMRHLAVRNAIREALIAYCYRTIDVPITVFRAANSDVVGADWCKYAEVGFDMIVVPGTHYTIMEEGNARCLGDAMTRQIKAATECPTS